MLGSAPPSGGFFSGIFPGTGSASAPPSGGLFSVVLSGSWGVFAEIPLSLPESELVLPPFFFFTMVGAWFGQKKIKSLLKSLALKNYQNQKSLKDSLLSYCQHARADVAYNTNGTGKCRTIVQWRSIQWSCSRKILN